MRFLHTSDWHLGRTLHGVDLHDAQAAFIDQLERVTADSEVDCVLVAGDIFDRAVPPVESVALFADALARLSNHATVIAVSGNHDSATRLGYGSALYREGVHVVTDLDRVGHAIEVAARGEVVLVYPIPYLDPDHARAKLAPDYASTGVPLARSHEAVLGAAIDRIHADRNRRGSGRQGTGPQHTGPQHTGPQHTPAVVVAHAFVVGGQPSDSERDISIGGVDSCPARLFSDFSYVALGHLHGPQQVAPGDGGAVIRYSGSPLRYSFSEQDHRKGVCVVDIDADGGCQIEVVELTQPRGMATLRGELADLLADELRERHAEDWVRVIVTDPARPSELGERVRRFFPHAIAIAHDPPRDPQDTGKPTSAIAADPVDVCGQFVADVTGAAATDVEFAVLRAAYESARTGVEL